MRTTIRSLASLLLTLVLTGFALVGTAGSASAADIYKYWGYFGVTDGAFVAHPKGPGEIVPADGAIEGWRYAAPADFTRPNLPRADLAVVTFEAVCGDKTAESGQKRVAVLVDYGVEADAAEGETPPQPEALCAVVPAEATGLQVLESVADIRTEKSSFGPSLCGVSGYPATGCLGTLAEQGTPADGAPVAFAGLVTADAEETSGSDRSEASDEDDEDSSVPMLVGAAALVLAVAGGGVFLARRNKSAA